MTRIVFPRCVGQIRPVDTRFYDGIVGAYVDKVRGIPGVLGVTQIGSISTPGLSDIDIIVTVTDRRPWPAWEQISLMSTAKESSHAEVVFHDVLVMPESIARHAEAFFFVAQQTVLLGDGLGGRFAAGDLELLKRMLTLEYAFHRLESLVAFLLHSEASLRAGLLLISSVRHTAALASELGVVSEQDAERHIKGINELRTRAIDGTIVQVDMDAWPERMIAFLWTVIRELGRELTAETSGRLPGVWCGSSKTAVVDLDAPDGLRAWRAAIARQKGARLLRRVRAFPAPVELHRHVAAYCNLDSSDGRYLRSEFASVGTVADPNEDRQNARSLRASLVRRHWEFLKQADYLNSSGKGYIGVNMPIHGRWQNRILAIMRDIQTRRVVSSLTKRSRA